MKSASLPTRAVVTVIVVWVTMLWVLIGTNWPVVFLSQLGQLIRELLGGGGG